MQIDSTEAQLIKLFESNFDAAKSLWIKGFFVDALSASLSIVMIFTESNTTVVLVIVIMLSIVASAYLKILRKRVISVAEEIRTAHLIDNGLGNDILQADVEQFKELSGTGVIRIFDRRQGRTNPYYDVSDAPGPKRLIAMLHEAAFFSWKMTKHARLFYLGLLSFPLIFVLIALLIATAFPQGDDFNSAFVQIIQVILAMLAGLSIVESSLTFSALSNNLRDLNNRITRMRIGRLIGRDRIILEAWKYALLQSHGELIPNRLFDKHSETILNEWNSVDADIRQRAP